VQQYPEAIAEARAEVYRWLAASLYKPEEDMLEPAFYGVMEEAWRGTGNPFPHDHWSKLMGYVQRGIQLPELTREFSRLFYGPRPLEAPPYESVYRDGRRLMGDSTMDVIHTYQAEGVELADEFKDMPDHVAAELDFMAHLCDKEAKAWKQEDRSSAQTYQAKQRAFLGSHLYRWIPNFRRAIIGARANDFYLAVAGLLVEYINQEAARLSVDKGN